MLKFKIYFHQAPGSELGAASSSGSSERLQPEALDPADVGDDGFPTIFKKALGQFKSRGQTDGDISGAGEPEASEPDVASSCGTTAQYDDEGFPLSRQSSLKSLLVGVGAEGSSTTGAEDPDPVTPSSRKRRTTALAGSQRKKLRGRPKKTESAKPKPPPKAGKTPRGKKNALPEDDALSRVCCCITDKPKPRAELTGYINKGTKRVHIFTLTPQNWGPNFAQDAKDFKEIIVPRGMSKSQAIAAKEAKAT